MNPTQAALALYRALYSAAGWVSFTEVRRPKTFRGVDPLTGIYHSQRRPGLSTKCQQRRTQEEIRADRKRERQARKKQRRIRKEAA